MTAELTADLLVMVWAMVQSLLFELIPPVKAWFETKVGEWKFAFQAGGVLAVWLAFVVMSYFGVLNAVTFTKEGIFTALGVLLAAIMANQGIYKGFVKPKQVREEIADYEAEYAGYDPLTAPTPEKQ